MEIRTASGEIDHAGMAIGLLLQLESDLSVALEYFRIRVRSLNGDLDLARTMRGYVLVEDRDVDFQNQLAAQTRHYFPQMLFSSTFVLIYALLESRLDQICLEIKQCLKLRLNPNALRDTGIRRSQRYIAAVAQLDFPDETPAWSNICICGAIRNKLIHADGRIGDDGALKDLPEGVSRTSADEILLSAAFVEASVQNLMDFARDLQQRLRAALYS